MILVDGIESASIPADDPGLLLGWTAFDTLRCYGGSPFRLTSHLDRLDASARVLGLEAPDRAVLKEEVARVCQGAGPDHRVRITLTGGGHRIVDGAPIPPGTTGRDVTVHRVAFEPPESLPGTVKHGSRLAWALAARRAGVDEVLLIDPSGHVLEASRSSVIAVGQDGIQVAPLDGHQLASVTRQALLEAAREAGLPVTIRRLSGSLEVAELYLASTLKELSPVVAVDGEVRPGRGPVGAVLHEAFRALVRRECAQGAAATS